MNTAEYAKKHGIAITAKRWHENPSAPDCWHDADHWRCVLSMGRRSMTVYFSKGYGHKGGAPTADEVLDCLAADAASADGTTFEDWAEHFGYDTDSRKAERTFKACQKQAKRLRRLLGEDLFNALVYEVERL
jgi:hypothetical protein